MILYFHYKLKELGLTYHQFFAVAHYWRFKTQPSLIVDEVEYQLRGTLPPYVTAYLTHLQGVESCAKPTAQSAHAKSLPADQSFVSGDS